MAKSDKLEQVQWISHHYREVMCHVHEWKVHRKNLPVLCKAGFTLVNTSSISPLRLSECNRYHPDHVLINLPVYDLWTV